MKVKATVKKVKIADAELARHIEADKRYVLESRMDQARNNIETLMKLKMSDFPVRNLDDRIEKYLLILDELTKA